MHENLTTSLRHFEADFIDTTAVCTSRRNGPFKGRYSWWEGVGTSFVHFGKRENWKLAFLIAKKTKI